MRNFSHTTIRWAALMVALVTSSLLLGACGGDDSSSDDPIPVGSYDADLVEEGRRNFSIFCTACHGPDAKGIDGLGVNLLESTFFKSHTDDELLAFISTGRPIDDPANTTGVAMPARGGYPNLADEKIRAIIAFIRTESAAN